MSQLDGQIIKVHPEMFAQQLQALNIHLDEEVATENGIVMHSNTTKDVETLPTVQTDAEAIVQALEVICFL